VANPRKVVFVNGETYHVFNRSIDSQDIFNSKFEYSRAVQTIDYYRFAKLPVKFSHYFSLDCDTQVKIYQSIIHDNPRRVSILAYCLMPTHYHFLLRQESDQGVSRFISDFSNSYSKYFNTKSERLGHLFQGPFKGVHINSQNELLHVSRYIHLNPVVSCLISQNHLFQYPWSSLPEYLNFCSSHICDTSEVLSSFTSPKDYLDFLLSQVEHGKILENIKHQISE
jgi:putative transposase